MAATMPSADQGTGTKTWRFESFNPLEFDMRLMLIGRTGSGKSSVGNTILGFKAFNVSQDVFGSTTKACSVDMTRRKGQRIRVLDTCGMFDTARTEEDIAKEIRKSHLMIAPGPHAFLLVVPVERFTKEQHDTVQRLEAIFPDLYRHTILVMAKADNLGGESSAWDTRLKAALWDNPGLGQLVDRVSRRYILLNNKEEDPAVLEDQVHALLDMVHDLHEANHQHYYHSDLFKKAEESAIEAEKAIISEIKNTNHEERLARTVIGKMLARKVEKEALRQAIEEAPVENAGRLAFINDVERGRADHALVSLYLSNLVTLLSRAQKSSNLHLVCIPVPEKPGYVAVPVEDQNS